MNIKESIEIALKAGCTISMPKSGKFKNIRVSFRVDNSYFIFYDIKYSI